MVWLTLQYGTVWDDFYRQCDRETQEMIDRRYDSLRQKGNLSRKPVSEHLEDGIFELRAKDARILFFFGRNRTIVFVHALIKKRWDVPQADIDLAKRRRKEILQNEVTPHALPN